MLSLQTKSSINITSIIIIIIFIMVFQSCSSIEFLQRETSEGQLNTEEINQISLLTYNIEAISEKNEDQVNKFISHINTNSYDFILLQELFNESTRDDIVERSSLEYYKTVVSRVDYASFPEFFFQDSGLFLMSRFPRVDLSDIDFGENIKNDEGFIFKILEKEFSRSYDFLSNKSVIGGLFKLSENKKVFLFTTHVQALGTKQIKEFQLTQISDFINFGIKKVYSEGLLNKDDSLSVIFAGDLNIDAYNNTWRLNKVTYSTLLEHLNKPRDLHKEFNGDKRENTWTWRSNSKYGRRFDYVFAYDSLAGHHFNKISVDEMELIDILDSNKKSISDHKGISTKLKIN